MSSKYYEGEFHIFDSDNSETVTIQASSGQDLNINCKNITVTGTITGDLDIGGTNKSVQYNNEGALAGDTILTYNGLTGELSAPSIVDEQESIDVGYNELIRNDAPQTVNTTDTDFGRKMGTDVVVSKGDFPGILFGCPFYDPNNGKGLGSFWDDLNLDQTFTESNNFVYSSFTGGEFVKYIGMNELATRVVLCTDDNSKMIYYTRTAPNTSWSGATAIFSGVKARLSGNYMLVQAPNRDINIWLYSLGAYSLQATLFTIPTSSTNLPMAIIDTSKVYVYNNNNNIRLFERNANIWNDIAFIPATGCLDLDAYGNIMCFCDGSSVKIHEGNILTGTLSITGATFVCTDGTYVFAASTDRIYIISKVNDIWTISTNSVNYCTGINKIACNVQYLAVGSPNTGDSGTGYIFKIIPYTNSEVGFNRIDLGLTGMKLTASNTFELNARNQGSLIKTLTLDSTNLTTDAPIVCPSVTTSNINTTENFLLNTPETITFTSGAKYLYLDTTVLATDVPFYAPSYSSNNGAFRLNMYQATVAQSITAGITTVVLFPTNVITEIPGLTKSVSNGIFTNTNSYALRLNISYSMRVSGSQHINSRIIGSWSTIHYGIGCGFESIGGQTPSTAGSCSLSVPAGGAFSVYTWCETTANISSNTGALTSTLNIYSLP